MTWCLRDSKENDVLDWRHIPSQEIVADVLIKGTNRGKIGANNVSHNGPGWLILDQSLWPVTEPNLSKEDLKASLCASQSWKLFLLL